MDKPPPFRDFAVVTLKRAVDVHGIHMPSGARGVVMGVYADGLAYEVEFEEPRQAVLTLEGSDLTA
jgi:hypothetical protein